GAGWGGGVGGRATRPARCGVYGVAGPAGFPRPPKGSRPMLFDSLQRLVNRPAPAPRRRRTPGRGRARRPHPGIEALEERLLLDGGMMDMVDGIIPRFGAHPSIVSIVSGPWSDPGTWSLGRVPGTGDGGDILPGTVV